MADIIMYSTPWCPYCIRARGLLKSKGVTFTDINVAGQPQLRQEMEDRSGRQTVPQIWIGSLHVGGCDDLFLLERQGILDGLLARP
ncbi:MAG TPA: glutaredoxin 3 [Candidatus Kapabacteria bacterium]|nr:glutaredoxin 3 [Candidatus Kapabacteria bacterium]